MRKEIITCDHCKGEIVQSITWYNAGSYGIELHRTCFEAMSAKELQVMLDLDADWQSEHGRMQITMAN